MIKLQTIPVTPFQQNCSIIWCSDTRKAAIIDPGGDIDQISAALQHKNLIAEKILITHGHIDHAGGAKQLSQKLDILVEGPHHEDQFWIDAMPQQSSMFGLSPADTFTPERWLVDGDMVSVGNEQLEVIHCPGHTPGHVIFFHRASRLAIVGDVLFAGSVGRTDFPRGDHQTLLDSIQQKLLPLGDDIVFYPGHGPTSTFGRERKSNPFLLDHG